MPTNIASPSVAQAARRPASSSRVGRLASSDSIEGGGFTPGAILAERYRIIGLLGRGGMGEVYRADDLKLGQPVALKFLPRHLASDRDRLERFYAEVRIARQVSHPNVCRVYDVGEIDGQQFLSMEYVDGEDLASLLKRIGRLPPDKALEIARELCAGLAAAHERGVLHRDLKPANVMLDGRGRARITDFGLAIAASEVVEGEVSGTPAYMAPEQLAGKPASVRSDIYSLGLVLYELSTGRKAFDSATLQELKRKHTEDAPASPSSIAPGFDPAVERVILRCLEKDPSARPASAAQIAAALPGGDPLAAAIAAGETPSPEMVAAAGERGGVPPSVVRRLLLGLAAAVALSVLFTPRAKVSAFAGVEKSPEVLRERAREVLQSAGLGKPDDWACWFRTDAGFLAWAASHGGFGGDMSRDAVAFDYRQSPLPLVPFPNTGPFPTPLVDSLNPAPVEPGMAEVWTDPRGRLIRLSIVPPQVGDPAAAPAETDWATLFRQAGLDMSRFAPVEPRWSPRAFATARAAWEGPHPERPGVTMRVEAASYHGRPVSFEWIGPWTKPLQDSTSPPPGVGQLVFLSLLLLCLIGAAVLARHNLRAGRGDRRGSARLGVAIWVLELAVWVLGGHHVATAYEGWLLIAGFTNAAGMGLGFWLVYLALEPFARRHWPQMLISWTRALSGRWRDPLVARDLLIGALVGTTSGLIMGPLRVLLPLRLGIPGPPPHPFAAPVTLRSGLAWLLAYGVYATFWVLAIVLLLVLARWIVRRGWLAGLIVTLVYTGNYLGAPSPWVTLPLAAISVGILVAVTVRFGVLAAIASETCRFFLGYRIYTSDPSNWAFYAGMIHVVGVLALAFWATRTALAGRPLFGGPGLEEKPAGP
jgi:serine/threonine-protein kinase